MILCVPFWLGIIGESSNCGILLSIKQSSLKKLTSLENFPAVHQFFGIIFEYQENIFLSIRIHLIFITQSKLKRTVHCGGHHSLFIGNHSYTR